MNKSVVSVQETVAARGHMNGRGPMWTFGLGESILSYKPKGYIGRDGEPKVRRFQELIPPIFSHQILTRV